MQYAPRDTAVLPARVAVAAVIAITAGALGCSAAGGDGRSPTTHRDAGPGPGWDAGPGRDSGPARPMPDAGFAGCASDSVQAMEGNAPVDIIWVVDSSGSMSNEAARVQENLNRFSTAMGMVGLDYHVVVITTSSYVSVPPPLGGSPRYLLIDRGVSSHEPLRALRDEWDNYSSFLRRTAITHIVAVTDDESDWGWMEFDDWMRRHLERSYTFHAIASERVPPSFTNPRGACSSGGFPPDGAAAPGEEYYALARATGGLTFSICTADWTGLFSTLTAAIAVPQPLPCVYPIPEPPAGMEFDPMRVNVGYTPGGATDQQIIPYVGGSDGADCTSGGWYYDDPIMPASILLCPSTCTALGGDASGRVDVVFGCQTFII